MNWKLKAMIQRVIAALPSDISYSAYYWLQRNLGDLGNVNPINGLLAGIEIWKRICSLNINPAEKIFFEVGTGRTLNVPISYWLLGANSVITIDLNPYLKHELVENSIKYIIDNKQQIEALLSPYLVKNRLAELIDLCNGKKNITSSIFDLCKIKYIAPGNASATDIENESIDFHTSKTVLEHIPPDELRKVILEGNRIIKKDGLFIHGIDYSDHFSHSDKKIPSINFLQFSDQKWNVISGNRYMYMNRLRHDDYLKLFESVGHRILINKPEIDSFSLELLERGAFSLNDKFKKKPKEILSISSAWLVTQKISS